MCESVQQKLGHTNSDVCSTLREHQLRKKVPPAEGRDLSNRYRKEIEIIHRLFQVKNTAD